MSYKIINQELNIPFKDVFNQGQLEEALKYLKNIQPQGIQLGELTDTEGKKEVIGFMNRKLNLLGYVPVTEQGDYVPIGKSEQTPFVGDSPTQVEDNEIYYSFGPWVKIEKS